LSELRKRRRSDPNVRVWFEQIPDDHVYTNVLVIGEIRRGIESLRRRDAETSKYLDLWLNGLERDFADRILPVNAQIADA
jgi:predicted nucleic acid-binding protein